jgi:tetratricopeptide (TPR) repeat protein
VITSKALIVGTSLILASARIAGAQSLNDARKAYDAGEYQKVVDAGGGSEDPRVLYIVAQSQQKLRRPDDARRVYDRLAARPAADPWNAIGQSALAVMSGNAAAGVQQADRAIAADGTIAEAHYQRGLALSAQQNMDGAAAAFQKASDLDPSWAYPHYYAGVAYSKVRRADLTASHFQTFLRLAPQAPERGEVQSILRTLGK